MSIDRWMDKDEHTHTHTCACAHTHTMEYYSAIKGNEIVSFAEIWMDLEMNIQSEVRKRKTNIMYQRIYVDSRKSYRWTYLQSKNRDTNIEWTYGHNRGRGGWNELGDSDWHIYTAASAAAAKSLQSCPTLCDPIDGSAPGSPIPGILQARTLEWVAISFSSAWKWKVKVKLLSHVRLFATPRTAA